MIPMFETTSLAPYTACLARSASDLRAAQRLRYDVFVRELGAGGDMVDHANGLETDRFDTYADHLLLRDTTDNTVIAVYRLMRQDQALRAGGFYTEAEYDLAPLLAAGKPVLELGRSCVHPDHRGGQALFHLWTALAAYVRDHQIELMFGVASLSGTNISQNAPTLSLLAQDHLAPQHLRVRSIVPQDMNLCAAGTYDRRAAMVSMPPLIKAYLRLGGVVGEGAYIDHAFNCTDVCMIMDTAKMNARHARHYVGSEG